MSTTEQASLMARVQGAMEVRHAAQGKAALFDMLRRGGVLAHNVNGSVMRRRGAHLGSRSRRRPPGTGGMSFG